jgi:DNA-binding CsgD family transcriptional regulator
LVRALTACCGTFAFAAEQAVTYFAEAIELARALGDKWRLSQLLGFQSYAAAMRGDAVAALPAGKEGRELADAIGDRFASGQCRVWGIGSSLAMFGDLPGAEAELRELIADADAAGDPLARFNGLLVQSFVLAWQGRTADARAASEMAAETAAELGGVIENLGYLSLATAEFFAGNVAAANQAHAQVYDRLPDIGFTSNNMRFRAETKLAAGDLVAARRWADQAVSATAGIHHMWALTTRARVALAGGDPESIEVAERDAHGALTLAADIHVKIGVPDIFDCLARGSVKLESWSEAARLLGAAEAVRRRTGEVRYTLFEADYEATVAALRDAMEGNDFDAAWAEGAALSMEEAIAYARRGRGERKRPSSGWASLTPTELDVVRLVSEGLGNKDIASRLFISPRTVETHLTHVYTKLRLSSRVQLAQEAGRQAGSHIVGQTS